MATPNPTRKDRTHWEGCWVAHEECEPPRRIYLQDVGGEISWCDTQTGEGEREPEYVRADLVRACIAALEDLHFLVWGECPAILDEDSGGSAHLDVEIEEALANLKGDE